MQYSTSLSYGQSVTDFATTLEASSNKQVSAAMPARLYYWSPPFVKSPTSWKPSFGSQRPRRSTLAISGLWLASQNLLEKVIERIYSHTTFEKDKLTLYSAVIVGILVYSFSSNWAEGARELAHAEQLLLSATGGSGLIIICKVPFRDFVVQFVHFFGFQYIALDGTET